MRETPYVNLSDLVSGIAAEVEPFLDMPFAFFGHSLGAMISFELARKLRRLGGPQPAHLFVSGSPAPHIVSSTATYNLPYDEFIEALRDLNGTPSEVLEHPELMQIMMPLLRADFEVHDTYKYLPGPRLDCPITAFGGLEDGNAQREDIEGWRDHTSGSFSFWMLPGDHFFLHTSQSRLMQILSRGLNPIVDTIKQR
jgi:surfactin synthase thioesterase subunit